MNKVVLLFITLFCCLAKNAFALKLLGIDFDKDIYRKMNVNFGYEIQKYTGGIDKIFDGAKNSSIAYKANKAHHAVNVGIGYNFYLNLDNLVGNSFLSNLLQPFIGFGATVRIPASGFKLLNATYDKNFDDRDVFGVGEAFGTAAIQTMPNGTIRGVITPNGDDGWIVTYYGRDNNELGQEIRHDFAAGTVGGSIERQTDGTWTAHMVNGGPGMHTFDYTKYIGQWSADPDSQDDVSTYSVGLKAYEFLVFDMKFGCRVFLNSNVSLSPYWMFGFNVAQAQVNTALLRRTINTTTSKAGFITGVGVEAIVMDRYALTFEYRYSVNKFNFASNGNELEIAANNLNIKFGYYFW